ncbi:YihY/virulence factor BrkB family protein [Yinghuangia seranimata]|uniref:YihY/virulence factor BrkB family protein n=1 Tax=Yinghuangia seranimata TaxID=408067 RepID=UPI00248B22C9|nr:YihY/virulence factor BrkB family protein [Yinghuangia seranimata]MDI2125152.1 YihY/virulence factor BrkB family protein [Yinghuangia seranimata]
MAADKKERSPVRGPGRIRLRSALWRIVRETFISCFNHRVTGLAAEAGFFMLLSLPPLLLGLAGTIGYLSGPLGQDTVSGFKQDIIDASGSVLSQKSVNQVVVPLVNDVFASGRADIISVGFVIALWSGSRALNVYVDTITIMYGLSGKRGIIRTRMLSFTLYVVGLLLGMFLIPLLLAGPELVVKAFPHFAGTVHILYWPVLVILSVCFLTTLYHVSVPVRTPWREDIPGALVALLLCILGSFLLRVYLATTIDGATVYGSLAAPVAVLVWMYFAAMAILIGAAINAAIDQVWPSQETAQARAEVEKERVAAEIASAMESIRRAGRHRGLPGDWIEGDHTDDTVDLIAPGGGDPDEPPAEFPERWANYAPQRGAGRTEPRNGSHRHDPGSPPVQLPTGTTPPGLSLDEQLWPPVGRPGGPDEHARNENR